MGEADEPGLQRLWRQYSELFITLAWYGTCRPGLDLQSAVIVPVVTAT